MYMHFMFLLWQESILAKKFLPFKHFLQALFSTLPFVIHMKKRLVIFKKMQNAFEVYLVGMIQHIKQNRKYIVFQIMHKAQIAPHRYTVVALKFPFLPLKKIKYVMLKSKSQKLCKSPK